MGIRNAMRNHACRNAPRPSPSPHQGGGVVVQTLESVADSLDGVKWESVSQLMARCPCHSDKRRSLAVGVDDGRILVHCFAGCDGRDILREIGVVSTQEFTGASAAKAPKEKPQFSAAYLAAMSLGLPIENEWVYNNADGSHSFSVYRLEGKNIRPVVPVGDGYSLGLPPAPRPLFRLPELLAHDGAIVVCEGEKAADAVYSAGWMSTTSCGGASAHGKSDWAPMALRRVLVWPDNDGPGLSYARAVAAKVTELGGAATILDPIGGPGDDAADCDDIDSVLIEAALVEQNKEG